MFYGLIIRLNYHFVCLTSCWLICVWGSFYYAVTNLWQINILAGNVIFQSTQVQWWLLGDDNKEMSDLRLLFLPISNYLYSCVHLFHTFSFKLKRQLFSTTIQVNKVWRTGEELCDMTGLG